MQRKKMKEVAFPLVVITWFLCGDASGFVELSGFFPKSMNDGGEIKFPQGWIERCGDKKSDVPYAKEKFEEFMQCSTDVINFMAIPSEFEEAKNKSQVSMFTKNECGKIPRALDCLTAFIHALKQCFDEIQNKTAWILVRMIRAMFDFICHRDGERVMIFLKDEGMECFTERKSELQGCVNNTSFDDLTNETLASEAMFPFDLSFNEKACRHLLGTSDCLIKTLRKCSDRTPSSLLNSLMKTMFKETPCWQYHPEASRAGLVINQNIFIVLSVVISLLYKRMA